MSVSLQKGQKVDLTKGNAGLTKIIVGLGWDPVKKGGFFGGILGGKETEIDCDASAIMLNSNNKLGKKENVVYFGNLKDQAGSVKHSGDNLTGDGDGDDEQIQVDLSKIPNDVEHLVFVVNIYDCQRRKQDFGLIQNAFIRVTNGANNQEVLKFNLSESYAGRTALIAGEVYRYNNEWKFAAIGEATNDISLSELVKRYM
jgi:stress response protein SCP2